MDVQSIVAQVIEELQRQKKESTPNVAPIVNGGEKKDVTHTVTYKKEKKVSVDNPKNKKTIEKAQALTPARIGIGRSGTRMKTSDYLAFRVDHAAAQDAVFRGVSDEFIKEMNLPILESRAESMEEYLMNLEPGRKLNDHSNSWLETNSQKEKNVQIVISDGLSSTGIVENIPDLLPALIQGLKVKNISAGNPIFIKRSRVWIQDEVAKIVGCDVVISLIGERPGLATSKSISAYMIYRPNENTVEADRTVISNIHKGGIPPVEAGAYLADIIEDILHHKASGVKHAQLKN